MRKTMTDKTQEFINYIQSYVSREELLAHGKDCTFLNGDYCTQCDDFRPEGA